MGVGALEWSVRVSDSVRTLAEPRLPLLPNRQPRTCGSGSPSAAPAADPAAGVRGLQF
jgi:hypothetical protein